MKFIDSLSSTKFFETVPNKNTTARVNISTLFGKTISENIRLVTIYQTHTHTLARKPCTGSMTEFHNGIDLYERNGLLLSFLGVRAQWVTFE